MYTRNVYGDYMQTTIRVEEDVVKTLDDIKRKERLRSYNEVIKRLITKRKLSMFGADKSMRKWNEGEDRGKDRQ